MCGNDHRPLGVDLLASQSLLRHYELDALWWFLSWDTSRERAFEFLHQRVALSQVGQQGAKWTLLLACVMRPLSVLA